MESSSQLSPGGPVPRPRRRSPRLRWLENLRDRLPQRSSLPQLMFAPFATQLLLAMALVLGLSYQMAGRIINQLTSELGGQIGERVLQELNAQLSAPRQVNAINARLLGSGLISPGRALELGPLLQTEMEQFQGLGYVQLARPDGTYIALERNQQTDELELSRQGPGSGLRPMITARAGADGQPGEAIRSQSFDARQMLWYQRAVGNPEAISGFSVPFGSAKAPAGVAGADIWPIQITRFLQNLQIGKGAAVLVVDQQGFVVGSSSAQKLYGIEGGRLVRQRATEASDPLVRGMAQLVKPRFGQELAERRSINGSASMVVTRMWNDPSGMAGAADAMAKGELDQRLQGSAIDEVNDLTLSFNGMAGQLRQSYGDLEASKNYQESILESMPSGVITFSESGLVRTANQASCRILGCELEQLVNRPATELFGGPNGWLALQLQEVQHSGESRQLLDTELALAAGTTSVNITLQPLQDPRLGTIGVILMLEDISEEKRIRGTMARYMDPLIAEQLLRSGSDTLGGVESMATVLFSDIRSFTSITEVLGAQGTVRFLNDYFTLMVDCLQQEGGMLDKFIGDAVMAVFGLPVAGDSDEDQAIRSAIAMQEVLGNFNSERQTRGEQPIGIGIGLHTDAVVSGNIGSPKRMNYTVIGDGVNLAARLESACKFYGAKLLVSDATLRRAKGRYVSREADQVVVKGKSEPVLVHELLDFSTEASFPNRDAVFARYGAGLQAYRQQQWTEAMGAFQAALALHPGDRLSALYLERCEHLQQNNPGPDWNGVWVMEGK